MLLQSHVKLGDGEFLIDILPALPSDWTEGKVNGLLARGNTEVDINWCNNAVKEIALTNNTGTKIAVKGRYILKNADADISYRNDVTYIVAEKGKKYELIPERNTL